MLDELTFWTKSESLDVKILAATETSIRLGYGKTDAEKMQVKMSLAKLGLKIFEISNQFIFKKTFNPIIRPKNLKFEFTT